MSDDHTVRRRRLTTEDLRPAPASAEPDRDTTGAAPGQRRAPGDGRRLPRPRPASGLLFESGAIGSDDLRWLMPLPWLAAGVAGLLAVVLTGRRRGGRDVLDAQACSASQSARARAAMSGLSEKSPSTPASRNARDSAYRSPGAFGSVPTRKLRGHELVLPAQRPHVHDQIESVGEAHQRRGGGGGRTAGWRGSTRSLLASMPSAYTAIGSDAGSGVVIDA